jgi:hypothetical protein
LVPKDPFFVAPFYENDGVVEGVVIEGTPKPKNCVGDYKWGGASDNFGGLKILPVPS